MKKLFCFGLLITVLALSGCVMRLVPKEMDRVDQEITGNRGVVSGDARDDAGSSEEKRKTRTVYDLEIEFFAPAGIEKPQKETISDKEEYGNKGYMSTKTFSEKDISPIEEKKMTAGQARSSEPTVIYQKASEPETKGKSSGGEEKTYVVQKGDTLQKISEKMYGTTKKWKNIYDANQNILKSPDDIRVGQKLVIPVR